MVQTRGAAALNRQKKMAFEKLAASRRKPLPESREEIEAALAEASDPVKNPWLEEFEIDDDVLGKGGSGSVRRATHMGTGYEVALKRIETTGDFMWDLVKREIEIQGSLCHPRVVRLFGCYFLPPDPSSNVSGTSPVRPSATGSSLQGDDLNVDFKNPSVGRFQIFANGTSDSGSEGTDINSGDFYGNSEAAGISSDESEGSAESSVSLLDFEKMLGNMEVTRRKPELKFSIVLIMELCPNGSLQDHFESAKAKCLPERSVANYVESIAEALLYLHSEENVLHRDIKPANILLSADWTPKVGDFGISVRDPKPRRQSLFRTPGFAAPELLETACYWEGPGHDERVDLWSLGVTAYSLLVGSMPFPDQDVPKRKHVPAHVLSAQASMCLGHAKDTKSKKYLEKRLQEIGGPMYLGVERFCRELDEQAWNDCFPLEALELELPVPLKFPDFVSEEAKDFLGGLLRANPCDRMSLEDVQQHPWIQKFHAKH